MRYQQGSCGCLRNFVTGQRHNVANPAPDSTRKFSTLTRYSFVTSVELDAIDLKILRELQRDGRMTNVELAERVGISAPPCLRRVRKLEEAGVIEGYHAMLNAPKLGFDLVAFCMIGLKRQSDSNLKAFAAATAGWSLVRQAWMVSGESDFLLHCVAKNLTEFQDFVIEVLTADENVDTVRTMLTIRQVKRVGLVEI
ncbi:Leucine-responsive regulatory protein [Agrobacterium tumefaciens]|nr:Leucine-responsive regulatory protein [Agrobacterium tumefaciens]